MGRISEYDHKRNKRLLLILPISVLILAVIAISIDRSHIIDKIFYIGYEGPPNFVPEITIIDEKSIESDVTRQEQHTAVAENVILDSDHVDESKNPDDITSKLLENPLKEPSFADEGSNLHRTYASHAEAPYRENYVILEMVKPNYPSDALALGIEGYVLVEAYITTDGTVAEAWVQSAFGPKSFERESLLAVRQFLFKPATEEHIQQNLMKRFVYVILFVILLGAAAYYLTKKLLPKLSVTQGKNISVIENVPLGPQKILHLIQIGDNRRLLIGSTNDTINFLADVTEDFSVTDESTASGK